MTKIDLHIAANTQLHKTDKYICTKDRETGGVKEEAELVLRRGQAFKMTLTFDRPYDKARDDLRVVFNTGKVYSGFLSTFSNGLAFKIMLNSTFLPFISKSESIHHGLCGKMTFLSVNGRLELNLINFNLNLFNLKTSSF